MSKNVIKSDGWRGSVYYLIEKLNILWTVLKILSLSSPAQGSNIIKRHELRDTFSNPKVMQCNFSSNSNKTHIAD